MKSRRAWCGTSCSSVFGWMNINWKGNQMWKQEDEEKWERRQQRSKAAEDHTKEMREKYEEQITFSCMGTKMYGPEPACVKGEKREKKNTRILVEDVDSVGAIMKYGSTGKTAALSFASYKTPCDGFMQGWWGQEISLCHQSFLYNVLYASNFFHYYIWNKQNRNRGMYLNRALYLPEVWFFRDGVHRKCDVISCAAPNLSAVQEYRPVSKEENTEILRSRIAFILDIARENEVDHLILGAYGCSFGQKAEEVAEIFKGCIQERADSFDAIIFAIPDRENGNYRKFVEVFESKREYVSYTAG